MYDIQKDHTYDKLDKKRATLIVALFLSNL